MPTSIRTSLLMTTMTATLALVGLATIATSYDIVMSARAANQNQFCYHHPLNQQRECFDNKGDCIKAQSNDLLADSKCTKV